MKILVYFIGKPRDQHANALASDFLSRAARFAQTESTEFKPGRSVDPFEKHASAQKIALDPLGKPLDSVKFSRLFAQAEMQGRDLVFLIGGHDGLPEPWRTKADLLLSLSAMTFSHEFARAMLAEQIYRAYCILKNLPYVR